MLFKEITSVFKFAFAFKSNTELLCFRFDLFRKSLPSINFLDSVYGLGKLFFDENFLIKFQKKQFIKMILSIDSRQQHVHW